MPYYKLIDSEIKLTNEGKQALDILGITLDELSTYPDEKLTSGYWQGCKTYVDQALKNGKGIVWFDDCRIPYKSEEVDFTKVQNGRIYGDGNCIGKGEQKETTPLFKTSGRFPANLIVSEDALNDGKNHNQGGSVFCGGQRRNKVYGQDLADRNEFRAYPDSGSFSRYFSLESWWEEREKRILDQPCFLCGYNEEHGNWIDKDGRSYCDECLISGDYLDVPQLNTEELPESVQKTFPFLIVPKASKSEKNKGCEGLHSEKYTAGNYSQSPVCKTCGLTLNGTNDHSKCSGEVYYKDMPSKHTHNNHPTIKPLKLMSYLITLGSRKGDTILDPYCGSGTTLLASSLLDRHCIGIDNHEPYCEIASRRCAADAVARIRRGEY